MASPFGCQLKIAANWLSQIVLESLQTTNGLPKGRIPRRICHSSKWRDLCKSGDEVFRRSRSLFAPWPLVRLMRRKQLGIKLDDMISGKGLTDWTKSVGCRIKDFWQLSCASCLGTDAKIDPPLGFAEISNSFNHVDGSIIGLGGVSGGWGRGGPEINKTYACVHSLAAFRNSCCRGPRDQGIRSSKILPFQQCDLPVLSHHLFLVWHATALCLVPQHRCNEYVVRLWVKADILAHGGFESAFASEIQILV